MNLLDPLGIFSSLFGKKGSSESSYAGQTPPQESKPLPEPITKENNVPFLAKFVRSQDGSGNNKNNPNFGKAGT